ncbi:MAG: chemotaxis protein CheW [Methyloprofundus sp.]|nr:chemotaxis protein CheW [Methyloprofundus sp.]
MSEKELINKPFLEPEKALDSYLSTLLTNISLETLVEINTEAQEERLTLPSVEQTDAPIALEEKEVPPREVAVTSPLAVMPKYAQEEFSALFFKVGHLILAVPLIDLGRTVKFDTKLTKIPQQPIWFMGLKLDQDKKIGVLNMAYLIHGRSKAEQRSYVEQPFKNIILTEDTNWGLACDEILSIKKITPNQVRWRTDRQRRAWLVGTIVEELVVLVDINALVPKHAKNK